MDVTLSYYNKTYSISTDIDDLNLDQVRDEILIPLLLAAGFHPSNVNDLFFDDDELGVYGLPRKEEFYDKVDTDAQDQDPQP